MPNQRQSNDKQQPKSGENIQQGGHDRDDSPGQQNQSGSGSKTPQQGGASADKGSDSKQQGGKSGQQGSKSR